MASADDIPLIDSLCGYCRLPDIDGCPVYPRRTRACEEFRPRPHEVHDAVVLIAGGLGESKDAADRQWRHRIMCEVITGER